MASGFGPFVVLLGQDRADKPQDASWEEEDADEIGPSPDPFAEARSWCVASDLPPDLVREGSERQDALAGLIEVNGHGRERPGRAGNVPTRRQAARRWC